MPDLSKCNGLADSSIGKITNISAAGVGKVDGFDLNTATEAKRLYFDYKNYVPLEPAYSSVWSDNYDDSGAIGFRCHSSTFNGGGTTGYYVHGYADTASGTYYCMSRQYITYPMIAQTVPSGTIKGQLRCYESDLSLNASLYLVVKLCGATGNVKTTILSGVFSSTEFTTSLRNRSFKTGTNAAIPYNSFSVDQDDRLVMEIGYRVLSKVGYTNQHGYLEMGNNGTSGDLPEDETTVTQLTPWIEFSQSLFFAQPSPYAYTWSTTTAQTYIQEGIGVSGDRDNALLFGGATASGSPPGITTRTQKWDGSSWATTSNMVSAIYANPGCGTVSAALSVGGGTGNGIPVRTCQKYSSNAWATTTSLPENRFNGRAAGTTSNAFVCGGVFTGPSVTNTTRTWDGSVWTTSAATLSQADQYFAVCGTSSAALANFDKVMNIYNGTSWATTSPCCLTRNSQGMSGSTSAALNWGGAPYSDPCTFTEVWNGSSWISCTSPLAIAVSGSVGLGTNSQKAMSLGGGGLSDLFNQVWG